MPNHPMSYAEFAKEAKLEESDPETFRLFLLYCAAYLNSGRSR